MKIRVSLLGVTLLTVLLLSGCAQRRPLATSTRPTVFRPTPSDSGVLSRWAPAFRVYAPGEAHNRIGHPRLRMDGNGRETASVDPQQPAIFTQVRTFRTARGGHYTNLIYRVHFPAIPFKLVPFHLAAGRNPGLLVVVTLNADGLPVLVTTVHTCGCYLGMVPTGRLPTTALPADWSAQPQKIYGEILPHRVDYAIQPSPRLLVHLRPGVHRVVHLEVIEDAALEDRSQFEVVSAPLVPMSQLDRLPVPGGTRSFFHRTGPRRGFVKGAVKPWETLLLGIVSLDPWVGTDKAYEDARLSGTPFYTSLKPWNRQASDMWEFADFLQFWGWRL